MVLSTGNVTGKLDFVLMASCSKCVGLKYRCSRVMPCNRCSGCGDCSCVPASYEWSRRAKSLVNGIANGSCLHSDVAKYQIYLQSNVYVTRKTILGINDVKDILSRIEDMDIGLCDISDPLYLPLDLSDFTKTSSVYKIEFMNNGHYVSIVSEDYGTNIMSSVMCMQEADKGKIPPKIMDTCNMNDIGIAYTLWCESINSPDKIISATGSGYWKQFDRILYTTLKVKTVVLSPVRMVTVTCLYYNIQHTF